uniref:Glycosyl transferase family 25 domain-containing protein n=1 Tax=viral metagenome TaxID=1070528 RepID=A0A6C0EBS6_9ZZZZ
MIKYENNLYNFFDKIICINLKSRPDRYESATIEFKKLNINNVEFYFAEKSSKGGKYGCFESHINVIKKCYNKGYYNILIFEDDLRPSNFYNIELLNESIEFMKNNNWDIFYLGYFIFNEDATDNIILSYNKKTDNIIQYNPCSTHTYCLNKKSMEKILSTYHNYIGIIHYDIYLSNREYFKNYCILPMLFEQHYCYEIDNETDNLIQLAARKSQCFLGDYMNINSNITYLIYFYNKYYYILGFIFIIFCIILYRYYNKFKFPN